MKELTALVASHNSIARLPEDVAKLNALQKLDLGHNQLESLPATALASLPLRSLDVSDNKLRMLPDALPVETLAALNVSRNPKLFKLPETIGACDRLAELRVAGCALTELPRAIDIPNFHFETRNVRCLTNALGVKGAGEAGATGACPAVMNAMVDALDRAEEGLRVVGVGRKRRGPRAQVVGASS